MAVINFNRVSKRFDLHSERARSFQETVVGAFRGNRQEREEFWALRSVSFEVQRGETVGLIGANGTGKSTVLKLISRIVEPTSGEIEVTGRVGALLELGAGFHPDLTGGENIYLNASIQGLSRDDVRGKFDQIVDFAELQRFIDVPVKHYSSGMYVRLGFAVAVHTEPEILLVDEVLGVGDAAFQRKCLDRIQGLQRQGVTIVFVSHNADAVRSLCKRAIWLKDGHIEDDGVTESVVTRYLAHSWAAEASTHLVGALDDSQRWGSGRVRLNKVRLLNGSDQEQHLFQSGEQLTVEIGYQATERIKRPVFGMAIYRSDGVHVTGPNTQFAGVDIPWIEGDGRMLYTIPALPLLEGRYQISLSVHDEKDSEIYDFHDRLYSFRVLPSSGERYGLMTMNGVWQWAVDPS